MKKIISILLASSFLAFSANAESMIGVKLGWGKLSGERTEDPSHGITSEAEGNVDHEYGAIFIETSLTDMVSVGLEWVPLEGHISTKDATASDTTALVSNLKTLYALVPFGSAYGKVGLTHVELGVDSNYTQNTVNEFDDDAYGATIGIGAQLDSPIPFMDVVRIEGNYTKFQEISITTTDTNHDSIKKSGEAELMTLSLSLAKSF